MFNLPPVSLFSLSPSMTLGYVLVGGVGVACIISGFLERRLFGGSHAYIFEWIDRLLKVGLPAPYFITRKDAVSRKKDARFTLGLRPFNR